MADADQSRSSFLHSSPLSPSFGLEATPTLSPAHPAFLLPSPADSTSSCSSSFSLHCGIPEPESPTGSSSSGGSLGGDALMSEAATCFSAPQMGSFSAQVTIVFFRKVQKHRRKETFFKFLCLEGSNLTYGRNPQSKKCLFCASFKYPHTSFKPNCSLSTIFLFSGHLWYCN